MRTFLLSTRRAALAVSAAAVVLAGSAAYGQPAAVTGDDFVTAAAGSDTFEVMSGRLALIESSSPAVRTFAKAMIREHTDAKAALAAAAARSGLPPPSNAMGGEEAAMLSALQGAGPQMFDGLYVRDQGLAHLTALETEAAYARSGTDGNLRQAAAADLPMIRRHLRQVQALGGPGGAP